MAGLLGDVLPFIYSRSNALKRNVNSLLDSPIDYLKQAVGQGNDDARVQNGLLADAVKEKGYGPANQALQNQAGRFASENIGPLMFIGKGAKVWDAIAAKKAEYLSAQGVAPRQIWSETGTWKAPDGKWRQEISDKAASTSVGAPNGSIGIAGPLEAAYTHKTAFDAYPQLRNIEADVEVSPNRTKGAYGTSTMDGQYLGANILARAPTQNSLNSILAHEVQHGVQDIEGFARGGSSAMSFSDPEAWSIYKGLLGKMHTPMPIEDYAKQAWGTGSITQEVADAYKQYVKQIKSGITPEIDRAAQETAAKEYYKRLAGEAEARATQSRIGLDDAQRRALFPEDSYDVPINQLIVRHSGNGPQMSILERNGQPVKQVSTTAERDAYVGHHKAPMKSDDVSAPLHDLTKVYPDDIYSPKAAQYYGHGEPALDR
jgi:hypothetical protein